MTLVSGAGLVYSEINKKGQEQTELQLDLPNNVTMTADAAQLLRANGISDSVMGFEIVMDEPSLEDQTYMVLGNVIVESLYEYRSYLIELHYEYQQVNEEWSLTLDSHIVKMQKIYSDRKE